MTSDEHFKFLSEKKQKPEPKKAKREPKATDPRVNEIVCIITVNS